jgi:hypothetical protein
MKNLIVVILGCLFFLTATVSLVFSEETIYPKDLPKFENFDEKGLVFIQKDFVDEGHQPWRSDPAYYAKFFMNFYYPTLSPNDRENLPAELQLQGNLAIVKIFYNGKEHIVYLRKVFPSNPESIWVVEKMIINEVKKSK